MTLAVLNRAESAAVDRLIATSGGAVVISVVRPVDVVDLWQAAISGNAEAAFLIRAVEQAQISLTSAPLEAPLLCAGCCGDLHQGQYSFGLLYPACDSPDDAIALALCNHCGEEATAIQDVAEAVVRRALPGIRKIAITHANGGRA